MPPIFKQKALIVALVGYFIGAYFHWRGRHLSTDDSAELKQGVGMVFDLLSTNFAWFMAKHNQNKVCIIKNEQTLEDHAAAINTVADAAKVNIPPVSGMPATVVGTPNLSSSEVKPNV